MAGPDPACPAARVRSFLLWAVLLFAAGLAVMAFAFRSRQARELLVLLRNAAWVYIALLFVLFVVQVVRMNT